jgi:hypothetical protein
MPRRCLSSNERSADWRKRNGITLADGTGGQTVGVERDNDNREGRRQPVVGGVDRMCSTATRWVLGRRIAERGRVSRATTPAHACPLTTLPCRRHAHPYPASCTHPAHGRQPALCRSLIQIVPSFQYLPLVRSLPTSIPITTTLLPSAPPTRSNSCRR